MTLRKYFRKMARQFLNKRILIITVLIILAVTAFFVLRSRKPTPPAPETASVKISSGDKTASLTIPPGALPEDISLKDISITRLSAEAYPKGMEQLNPIAVYRLEPNGAVFKKPLAFSLTLDKADDPEGGKYFPILVSVSGKTLTVIENVFVEDTDKSFVARGTVDNFSYIALRDGFFAIEVTASRTGKLFIGDSVTVSATIRKRDFATEWPWEGGGKWRLAGDPEFWDGRFRNPSYLVPHPILDKPPGGTVFTGNLMTVKGEATCALEGWGFINYEAQLDVDYEYAAEGFWGEVYDFITPSKSGRTKVSEKGPRVDCIKRPTEAPTRSPDVDNCTTSAPPPATSCDIPAFRACADAFSLHGCIDTCPYVPRECSAGSPPDTECKETDKACSDQCWTRADAHLDSCLKSNNCTKKEVQAGGGGASR